MSATRGEQPDVRRHGVAERLALAGLGTAFLLAGSGLAVILLRISWIGRPGDQTAAVAAAFLFAAVGAYGAWLLRRGLRGWSRVTVLDRASPELNRELRDQGGVGLLIFVLFAALSSHRPGHGSALQWTGCWLLFALLGLMTLVAAHELGHLVPGLLQRRRLTALRIWPFQIDCAPKGARISVAWRTADGFLGAVFWSPGSIARTPWADRVMLLGGPLANASLAALLLAGASMWPTQPPVSALPTFLSLGAFFNACVAVVNLLPLKNLVSGGTDGSKIVYTFDRGYRSVALIDRAHVLALQRRPREWSVSVAEFEEHAAVAGTTDAARAWLLLFAASVALDAGNQQEAERMLELGRTISGASAQVRRELGLQRTLMTALLIGDPVTARAELDRTAELMPPEGYDALALAAVLVAEGRSSEAVEALARWRRDAAAVPIWEAGNQWALERLDAALARQVLSEAR